MRANSELKKEIRQSTVKQWQIADYLEMSESALSKSLRYELSDDEIKAIKEAIKALEKWKEGKAKSGYYHKRIN